MDIVTNGSENPAEKKKIKRFLTKSKNSTKTKIFLFCMMFLPFVSGVFYDIFNKAFTIKLMFSDQAGSGFGTYYIGQAFKALFTKDSEILIAVENAIGQALYFNFICLPLQLIMAYFLYREIPFTKAFRIIIYLPTMLSVIVTTNIFFVVFQSEGALVGALKNIGIQIPSDGLFQNSATAMLMIRIFQFWSGSGVTTTIACAAMKQINPEMIEAARLDGIGFWREFFNMVIPTMLPMLSVWFVMNMSAGFGYYAEILTFTPTTPIESRTVSAAFLINEKAKSMGRAQFESAGIGFIFTLLAIPMVYGVRKLLEKIVPDNAY